MEQELLLKGRKKDSIEQFISGSQLFLENGLSQLRYMVLVEDYQHLKDTISVHTAHMYGAYYVEFPIPN